MSKLIFNYGCMNSGKSIDLLKTNHNYIEEGYNTLILKPSIDTRDEEIKSRIGASAKCEIILPNENLILMIENYLLKNKIDILLVDEGQFLTKEQVEQLAFVCDYHDIPTYVYGLKNDFLGNMFEGTKRLFELADKVEEIKTICHYCKNKATHNLLFNNGKVVRSKDSNVAIESQDNKYEACCRKHYMQIMKEDN